MPVKKAESLVKQHIRLYQSVEQAAKKAEEVRRHYDPSYNPRMPRKRAG
jgi:hypothetical protein